MPEAVPTKLLPEVLPVAKKLLPKARSAAKKVSPNLIRGQLLPHSLVRRTTATRRAHEFAFFASIPKIRVNVWAVAMSRVVKILFMSSNSRPAFLPQALTVCRKLWNLRTSAVLTTILCVCGGRTRSRHSGPSCRCKRHEAIVEPRV